MIKTRSIRKTISAKSRSIGFSLVYMRRVKRQNNFGSFAAYDILGLPVTGFTKNIMSISAREVYNQNILKRLSRYTFNIGYRSSTVGLKPINHWEVKTH